MMFNFDNIWTVCVIGGFVLTPVGMVITYLIFARCERAYPKVFNLQNIPITSVRKAWRYWGYVLLGNYRDLDQSTIRIQCTVLRVFFFIYLIMFSIAIAGIVTPG